MESNVASLAICDEWVVTTKLNRPRIPVVVTSGKKIANVFELSNKNALHLRM